MGVDAALFAKDSKKFFYFDRLYNLLLWVERDDWEKVEAVCASLRSVEGASAEDVIWLAKENLKEWTKPEDAHRAHYNQCILTFVANHPNDRFFVRSDHDEPPYYDLMSKYGGEYEEEEI